MLYTLFCLGVLGVFSLHMLLLCLVNHSRTADTADKPTDAMHTELSDYSRTYIGGYNSALRSRSLKGWPTEKTYLDDRFNAHSIFIAIVEQTRIHTQGGAANFARTHRHTYKRGHPSFLTPCWLFATFRRFLCLCLATLPVRSSVRWAIIKVGTCLKMNDLIFAARCYTSAAYAVMRCPSVGHVREFCRNE